MGVPANIPALMLGAKEVTFPVEEGSRVTFSGSGSSIVCALPTGVMAGEHLFVFIAHDEGEAVSFDSGFSNIGEIQNASDLTVSIGHKVAEGGDTAPTATWAVARVAVGVSTRVSGGGLPEISTGATGSGTAHDPDSLTPTGGSKKYLWFAVAGVNFSIDYTSAPSGYGTLTTISKSGGPRDVAIGLAARENEVPTENPGAFTGTTGAWGTLTLAIPPV